MNPFDASSYEKSLRSLGQALEMLGLDSFALEGAGDICLVRGETQLPADGKSGDTVFDRSGLPSIWLRLKTKGLGRGIDPSTAASPVALELRYTPQDISRIGFEGQARRLSPCGIADPGSLAQQMRAVGSYLDGKGARLLGLLRLDERVTVHYDLGLSRWYQEHLTLPFLRDLSATMYLKRAFQGAGGASS